jgi:hypothetical protein
VRSKQDYIIADKNGKQVPEKIGLKGVQREGLEYDFSILFEIDIHHFATCSKDRTQLFQSDSPFKLDSSVGEKISNWCTGISGGNNNSLSNLKKEMGIEEKISKIFDLEELHRFYKESPNGPDFIEQFTIQAEKIRNSQIKNPFNFHRNGR